MKAPGSPLTRSTRSPCERVFNMTRFIFQTRVQCNDTRWPVFTYQIQSAWLVLSFVKNILKKCILTTKNLPSE